MPSSWRNCSTRPRTRWPEFQDPFLDLARALYPAVLEVREKQKARRARSTRSMPAWATSRSSTWEKGFIPDANNTLRLTYGRIKGYSPADAVYYEPFTTLRGVLEKTTGREPFDTPAALFDLSKARDFGAFEHPNSRISPSACFTIPTPPAETREPGDQRPGRAGRGQFRPDLTRRPSMTTFGARNTAGRSPSTSGMCCG